ncbi:MAG: LPS export ABC transporter periplasmic protein LptC, partial [Gemmatimonadota bacterium]|nr:LPS export ABC transporter periplasmic protein LptC [Gemmatimonadota bacterium]
MRALALFAGGLVCVIACAEKKALPTARGSALADSADQVMFGAKFSLTSQGIARARLNADTAYFFDENTRAELEKVHTTFFTTSGESDAVLTSRRGTYNTRLATMVARENVVVVSEDGRRLETSELMYSQPRNEISSDSAFVLTEPNRRLEGIGFRSDPNMNNIRILKGASGIARSISTGPAGGAAPAPSQTPAPPPVPTA